MDQDYPKGDTGIHGIYASFQPWLFISDPEMLQELYFEKNKFFDKHQLIKEILNPLMGDATLLAPSNEAWSVRRKSLS